MKICRPDFELVSKSISRRHHTERIEIIQVPEYADKVDILSTSRSDIPNKEYTKMIYAW